MSKANIQTKSFFGWLKALCDFTVLCTHSPDIVKEGEKEEIVQELVSI